MTAEPLTLRRVDWRVVGLVALLSVTGFLLQLSVREAAMEGTIEWRIDFASRQLRWYGVGALAAALVMLVPYKMILDRAYWAYAGGLALLVAVFLVGMQIKGARRWISLGPIPLQPSEIMKVLVVVVLARYIRFRRDQRTMKGLVVPFLLTAVPMALIMRQPDLGTALLFVPVLFGVLYASGAKPRHLGAVVAMGIAFMPVVYFGVLKEYQQERIRTFISIHKQDQDERIDLKREGWHAEQSRLAVASGGLVGLGWSDGPQNRAGAVPEHQTDFIATVLGEEFGFLGMSFLVLLYGMLFASLAGIATRTRDPAGKLLVTGVLLLLAGQAFVNLAMTVGLGPITGVPLPFLSYGGSSTVTTFVAIGLALNVAARPGFDFGPSDFD
ncbi:MAG: rod shape-determining protein RodA [Planctomycetota bacterium]|jgi:rod shape determining protein RodA